MAAAFGGRPEFLLSSCGGGFITNVEVARVRSRLLRNQQESVARSVEISIASNLAGVADGIGRLQVPTGIGGNVVVEILHSQICSPHESVSVCISGGSGVTHNFPRFVDGIRFTHGATKSAQIQHAVRGRK